MCSYICNRVCNLVCEWVWEWVSDVFGRDVSMIAPQESDNLTTEEIEYIDETRNLCSNCICSIGNANHQNYIHLTDIRFMYSQMLRMYQLRNNWNLYSQVVLLQLLGTLACFSS